MLQQTGYLFLYYLYYVENILIKISSAFPFKFIRINDYT